MYVMGLDIGYSNLKSTFGDKSEGEKPSQSVLPAGAGPVELLPQRLGGGARDCIQVVINGEKWAVGVEPEQLQGWNRELHEDYTSSQAYRAMFLGSLLMTGQEKVDKLVTGLPVSHFRIKHKREKLVSLLEGKHDITPKRSVTVDSVVVVPQPAGTYLDVVNSIQDEDTLDAIENGKTVVLDPGFFSVDWVALEGGDVRYQSSGTSLKAMSVYLEEVDKLIADDHGVGPGLQKIEKQIRGGKDSVYVLGQKVELSEYKKVASDKIARIALTPMRQSMREEGMAADVVIVAGGGTESYIDAVKELFPKSKVIKPKNPVISNANGFWEFG